jgi:hypothetical protein
MLKYITITTATETETVRCKFTRIRQAEDGALSIYFDRDVYDIYAQQTEIYCELIPQDESVIISAVADNGNVAVGTIIGEDSIYYIELFGKKAGISTVTVYVKDVYTGETVAEQSITVVIKPSEMMTNPETNGVKYTGPVTISKNTHLSFIAKAQNKNNSLVVDEYFKQSLIVPF